jgi:hypothetical protein
MPCRSPHRRPANNPLASLHKGLDAHGAFSTVSRVVGDRAASLMEVPERGQVCTSLYPNPLLNDAPVSTLSPRRGFRPPNFQPAIANRFRAGPASPLQDPEQGADRDPRRSSLIPFGSTVRSEPSPYSSSSCLRPHNNSYGPEGWPCTVPSATTAAWRPAAAPTSMDRAIQHARGKVGDLAARKPSPPPSNASLPVSSSGLPLSFPHTRARGLAVADDSHLAIP